MRALAGRRADAGRRVRTGRKLAAAPLPFTTLGVVNHDIGRRDGRRAMLKTLRARSWIVVVVVRMLAAALVRNALRAFSGRSQGVGVVMAWESGRIGRREALRGSWAVRM